ncbi:MAG: alpha/beta fold hydrolase [Alphaproteobacteria bacterium]|nr:alpha/beta fold hydrolase [Alphaproteobacteria bacterium]
MTSYPPFKPRFPWVTGDLQTVRNFFAGPRRGPAPQEVLTVDLGDGTGDRCRVAVDRPGNATRRPILLIHGLTGCEGSAYMLQAMEHFLAEGRPVIRMNQRGAGPGAPLAGQHYHAGRSRDIAAVIAGLPADLTADGLVAMGFSLGGNALLKYMGEQGRDTPVMAAVSISAPIDLSLTSKRFRDPRNRIYHKYLLDRMRAETLHPAAQLTAEQARAVREAKDIFDYDDRVVAPRGGFAGAEDYYARNMARRFLPAIGRPTLLIHAQDDPWIPYEAYRGNPQNGNNSVDIDLPEGGGHVGFHGVTGKVPWHLLRSTAFFDAVEGRPVERAKPGLGDQVGAGG